MKKLPEYLIYLYIFFTIIDPSGLGSLSKIPLINLPIKYFILAILFLLFIVKIMGFPFTKKWPRNIFVQQIISIICFAVFFILVGILRGNEFGYVIKDSLGFLYYAVGIVFMSFLVKQENIFGIIKTIIYASFIVNIFLIATEYLVISSKIPVELINIFLAKNNLGIALFPVSDNFFRIMIRSGIFVQIGLVLAFSLLFINRGRQRLLLITYIVVGMIGLLILFSRGYFFGALISLFIILILSRNKIEIKVMAIIFSLMVLLCFISIGMADVRFENPFWARVFSSFNFSSDESNLIRAEQFGRLSAKIQEHPLIGGGYGAYIEGYSRDEEQPYYFELDYLAMIMKFGLLGFGFLVFWFINLFRKQLFIIKNIINKEDRVVAFGVFAAVIGLMVTAATNPYLNGLLGNFIIILSMLIFNLFQKGQEKHA